MFIETSVIVAIMLNEDDAPLFLEQMENDPSPGTSVVNAFEAMISVGKRIRNHERAVALVRAFIQETGLRVEGIPVEALDDILDAYVRYGKGTGHPAKLNFGDCFSYAMAKRADVRLLYKGNDFAQTDLA